MEFRLETGSRIGVIGGGPAGSFFSYFLLSMASRIGVEPHVDIYEPKDYTTPGPAGCNMCGGIVSESLVQMLTVEGINVPSRVIQRGIDSYVLHMDAGTVRIDAPRKEKRIGAVHRGAGPRGISGRRWESFDAYLLGLSVGGGARLVRDRVEGMAWEGGRPRIGTKGGASEVYDLVAVTTGVNSATARIFGEMGVGYVAPKTTKTFICEFLLGEEAVRIYLGSAMHVFLPGIPRIEFAALIPKGEYVTVCLLGEEIDARLVETFLDLPEVRRLFPPDWSLPKDYCRCYPSITVRGSPRPFADRLVFIGDCGENRLYKDGIGGAYRTAKAAAKTVVFNGFSAEDFRKHYLPVCKELSRDNDVGRLVFLATKMTRKVPVTRRGLLRMVTAEQEDPESVRRMSGVLWDTFTGSAPYRSVFLRTLHPMFLGGFLRHTIKAMVPEALLRLGRREETMAHGDMGQLGRLYRPGEVIVRQGDVGDCMYVIQSGKVEVIREEGGREVRLAVLDEGDFFGEMALFEKGVRSATVRPLGDVRVLTVDRKMFLRKIHDDPSLAFRIMQKMSRRIRDLNDELARVTHTMA